MMEVKQDHDSESSPPPEMAIPASTGFFQVHDQASRMKHLVGSRGNGLGAAAGIIAGTGNAMAAAAAVEQKPRLELEMKFPNLDLVKMRKPVKYRECLKNHAASLGGHAVDGCGEFMPSGAEGTLEALKCAACDCHRNFHRREVEGETDQKMKGLIGPLLAASPPMALMPAPPPPPQMIMAMGGGPKPAGFDDQDGKGNAVLSPHSSGSGMALIRKRFRTKFSSEQKERMWEFAEKVGWRIQKHDEQAVFQFCSEVGVKRHVLKVWMHNNKNTLGRKPPSL